MWQPGLQGRARFRKGRRQGRQSAEPLGTGQRCLRESRQRLALVRSLVISAKISTIVSCSIINMIILAAPAAIENSDAHSRGFEFENISRYPSKLGSTAWRRTRNAARSGCSSLAGLAWISSSAMSLFSDVSREGCQNRISLRRSSITQCHACFCRKSPQHRSSASHSTTRVEPA